MNSWCDAWVKHHHGDGQFIWKDHIRIEMAGCGTRFENKTVPEDFVIPKIVKTSEDCPEMSMQHLNDDNLGSSSGYNNNNNNSNNNNKKNNNSNNINNKNNIINRNKSIPNKTIGGTTKNDNPSSANNLDPKVIDTISTSFCSSIDTDTIYLLVSGKTFCVQKSALLRFPNTKLGQLASQHGPGQGRVEYVFDRNSKIVAAILDFYRTGELHLPSNLCSISIRRELKYWGILDDFISECCYGRYKEALRAMRIVDELDKVSCTIPHPLLGSYKEQIWNVMEKPGINSLSWVWLGVYMSFILLSIVLVSMSTCSYFRVHRHLDDLESRGHDSTFENLLNTELSTTLAVFDILGLVFFTIEPIVRLWASPEPRAHIKEFLNLLDFLLALDHWLCVGLEASDRLMTRQRSARVVVTILRSGLSLRVLRIFHLTRKNVKTKVLLLTFRASLMDILLLLLGLSIAIMVFATLMYYAEMIYDTENFQNIPQAIWWAIITTTTVGYGDFYPTTFPGYVVGVACALSGILLLSMPIAITATNFNTYYCGLVARDQRQRRSVALTKCGHTTSSIKRTRKTSSDDSLCQDVCTITTNCDDEYRDGDFWLDDFSDFEYHYQSDGAIDRRVQPTQCHHVTRASSPAPLRHSISEKSVRTQNTAPSRRYRLTTNDVDNSKEPNHLNRCSAVSKTSLSTPCIPQEIKREIPNYNSITSHGNSRTKQVAQQSCDHTTPRKVAGPPADKIKKRKRKFRARKKTRIFSPRDLTCTDDSHSDC